VFNFGKHRGKPVEWVLKQEPSYYNWMINGDFPQQTKRVLTRLRLEMMNH
jgi:DNA polymerase-3 subunit epsilon